MGRAGAWLVLGAAAWLGCGGASLSPNGVNRGSTPRPGPAGEVNVGPAGLNPARSSVVAGAELTFVNVDTIAHQMMSNPHPEHSGCPELNGPVLRPGERITLVLQAVGECELHDHLNAGNVRFHGRVEVVPAQ